MVPTIHGAALTEPTIDSAAPTVPTMNGVAKMELQTTGLKSQIDFHYNKNNRIN